MLIEFRVTNFRSFRDEQRFGMVASSDRLLPDNLAHEPALKWPLLRSAVIYGPNASGKSNLLLALHYMRQMVLYSTQRSIDPEEQDLSRIPELRPFLFDAESRHVSSQFEISFIADGTRFEYGFRLNSRHIEHEWLFAYTSGRAQRWLERERQADGSYSWYFGPRLQGKKQEFADIAEPHMLCLSYGPLLKNAQLTQAYSWFKDQLRVISSQMSTAGLEHFTVRLAQKDPAFHRRVVQLLSAADLRVHSFEAHEIAAEEDHILSHMPAELAELLRTMGTRRLEVQLRHQVGNMPEPVALDIDDESLGTQRMFALAGPLIDALLNGRVLCVDELDDSLHPTLVRQIVALFHDPAINTRGAQLIFNTHDVTLLDVQLLRRDQIWLMDRDRRDASQLYSLSSYRPRNSESLMRGYLTGRYAGLPFVDSLREQMQPYLVRGDSDAEA